jgi:hypothetical protein
MLQTTSPTKFKMGKQILVLKVRGLLSSFVCSKHEDFIFVLIFFLWAKSNIEFFLRSGYTRAPEQFVSHIWWNAYLKPLHCTNVTPCFCQQPFTIPRCEFYCTHNYIPYIIFAPIFLKNHQFFWNLFSSIKQHCLPEVLNYKLQFSLRVFGYFFFFFFVKKVNFFFCLSNQSILTKDK